MIRTVKIEAIECTCERCGNTWIPRPVQDGNKWTTPTPIACAVCKSPYWNRPRKEKSTRVNLLIGGPSCGLSRSSASFVSELSLTFGGWPMRALYADQIGISKQVKEVKGKRLSEMTPPCHRLLRQCHSLKSATVLRCD